MRRLLEIDDLCVSYGDTPILYDVDLRVGEGEIVGVVGESGSGKSTLVHAAMRVLRSGGCVDHGRIVYDGVDLAQLDEPSMAGYRGSEMSMVFQNPMATFSPVRTLKSQFIETIRSHTDLSRAAAYDRAVDLLVRLGLDDVGRVLDSYSFELSGGMCQRAALAVAMTLDPRLLFADEPTSALDVTVQAQVVKQLMRLRDEFGTSIVMVTHNMGVVFYMADTIVVMYAGRVVEYGSRDQIRSNPSHPYTRALIESIPRLGGNEISGIAGNPYVYGQRERGCCFYDRCPEREEACARQEIPQREVEAGHLVACRRVGSATTMSATTTGAPIAPTATATPSASPTTTATDTTTSTAKGVDV